MGGHVPSDPDDPLTGHEQIGAPLRRGVVQLGVAQQLIMGEGGVSSA